MNQLIEKLKQRLSKKPYAPVRKFELPAIVSELERLEAALFEANRMQQAAWDIWRRLSENRMHILNRNPVIAGYVVDSEKGFYFELCDAEGKGIPVGKGRFFRDYSSAEAAMVATAKNLTAQLRTKN